MSNSGAPAWLPFVLLGGFVAAIVIAYFLTKYTDKDIAAQAQAFEQFKQSAKYAQIMQSAKNAGLGY